MRIVVTGIAGFVGMHAALRLLERFVAVAGIGNRNGSRHGALKRDRADDNCDRRDTGHHGTK